MAIETIPIHGAPIKKGAISQLLACVILHLIGWELTGQAPTYPKYLVIGAPHTSNWDFLMMFLLMFGLGIDYHWVGKDTLFRGPVGILMRRLGGIPVNRRVRGNFVKKMVDLYSEYEDLALLMSPEGTRSKTKHWKSGFYYIALGAQVPIALGYLDYGKKELGLGPTFMPSGDINADMDIIRQFYTGKVGKNPNLQGEIKLSDEIELSE